MADYKLTPAEKESVRSHDTRPMYRVPQVTLLLLLSQIPSFVFLHRMSDETLYRQFRLCMTTAETAAAKASG